VNLLICTVVKPFAAVFVAYSHATSKQVVGLEFCLVYSIISSASLCILPWSLFLLSWHLYLAGIRAARRALGVPDHVTWMFGRKMIAASRMVVESEVASIRSDMSTVSRLSRQEKRVQIKARMIEDGPSKRQTIVIGGLWIGRIATYSILQYQYSN